MKTFVAICTVLACVQGNAISQQKCPVQGAEVFQRLARLQLENINLRKDAGEEVTPASLGLPGSTEECDWTSGLSGAADAGVSRVVLKVAVPHGVEAGRLITI